LTKNNLFARKAGFYLFFLRTDYNFFSASAGKEGIMEKARASFFERIFAAVVVAAICIFMAAIMVAVAVRMSSPQCWERTTCQQQAAVGVISRSGGRINAVWEVFPNGKIEVLYLNPAWVKYGRGDNCTSMVEVRRIE